MGFTFERDWLNKYGKNIGVGKLGCVPWLSYFLVKAAESTCQMTNPIRAQGQSREAKEKREFAQALARR